MALDPIGNNERAISEFVDRVSSSYQPGSNLQATIERQSQIGRYTINGSYEPLIGSYDLNYKLQSKDPSPTLNTQSIYANPYNYAQSIYGSMGMSAPVTRTFAGDLAQPLSTWQVEPLSSKYVNNSQRTAVALGAGSTTSLLAPSGLEDSMMKLASTLNVDYGIKIQVSRITDLGRSSPTSLSVTVPNISIDYDGTILTQEGERDLLRTSAKTFTFSATELGGVIELGSNRYIGGSLVAQTDGTIIRQSSAQTATGYIATYVLQQQIILDQGTSLAFRQFLSNQQSYNPNQNYLELDKFLGKALGAETTFSQYINSISDTATSQDFLNIQSQLASKLGVGLDPERFSQVSSNELAQIRTQAIAQILAPLGATANRQNASQQVIKNLARELLSPTTIQQVEAKSIRVDAFTQLKLQILAQSAAGNALLQNQITSMLRQELSSGRKNLLDQLRAPFLQPHETNYSGAQQLGKLAYYARDTSNLTAADGRSQLLQLGGMYQHGGTGIPIGGVYTQISAQSSSNKLFSSKYHDSQLEGNSRDTVNFFDLQTLFKGSRQLNTTTLANLSQSIGDYANKQDWLTELQQELSLNDNSQEILITPYRKVEQIPQRLKNLSGTRPAIEYSLDFYTDILNQKDLSSYYRHDAGEFSYLDRGKAISANINPMLPGLQYQRAAALNQQMLGTDRNLLNELRTIESNPQAELRGFVTNSKLKRLLIATGANQGSDFMHLNSAHQSVYGYEQYTKIEIESVQSYDPVSGKLHASNLGVDLQRQLLQSAFTPGNAIYYKNIKLNPERLKTQSMLTTAYDRILAEYAGKAPNLITAVDRQSILGDSNTRSAISSKFKRQFDYIGGVSFDRESGQLDFTLKAGLYGTDENGVLKNYGLFDGDSSRLLLGLAPTVDRNGQFRQAKQLAVKISGTLRKDQQGVGVVNNLLNFDLIDGRLTGHAAYTILFDGSVRPGVENVKGPARYDDRQLFDYYAERFAGIDYANSERTLADNHIYGIAAAASLKGYNYETGLDVLTTAKSTELFIARLRKGGIASTALFASYFASDLSALLQSGASEADAARLKSLSADLQAAIKVQLMQSSEYDSHLKTALGSLGKNSALTKNANLFVNNDGLFSLLDSDVARYRTLGVAAPLAQLQESLLRSLQTGDDRFLQKTIALFDSVTSDSFEHQGYRTFDQSSGRVRAAGFVSDILGTSYQILDYARARAAMNPLHGSILELNLIDRQTGKINHGLILGNSHLAVTDLLYRAKVELPRPAVFDALKTRYANSLASGKEFTPGKKYQDEYEKFTAQVANIYAASQGAIPLQRATIIAPSKILQAAGSKESANLEYHYSIAMSKNSIDKMRGYVSDPNELSEITAAYRMLVTMTQSKSLSSVKFMSPFLGSEQIADYRIAYANLDHASSLTYHISLFGEHANRSLFAEYAKAAVSNNTESMQRIITGMQALDATARFYTGSTELQLADRAVALATASDTRRSRLVSSLPTQSAFDLNRPKVFFDLETSKLLDQRFPEGDARRYPSQSVNELTFIFGTEANSRVISWRASEGDSGEFKSRAAALTEVSRLLSGEFADAALVGHNIRRFDIPTLDPLLPGLDLNRRQVIDTLHDADRLAVKRVLETSKFNLPTAYKEISRLQLQAASGDPEASRQLASGDYGKYSAHTAEADVRANIEVFNFMTQRNLFARPESGFDLGSLGGSRLFDRGSIVYYDYGRNSLLYSTVRELAVSIYNKSGGSHLAFHYQTNRADYRDRAAQMALSAGLNGDLVANYTEQLLFDSMNSSGRLALGRGVQATDDNVRAYFDTKASALDLKVETAIRATLQDNEVTYIDTIERQALAYQDERVSLLVKGDAVGAERAGRLYSMLQDTKVVVMPHLNTTFDPNTGSFKANLVAAGRDQQGNQQALLGNSLIYLGNDILKHLPKEFETFVPEIIRQRRELDSLLPSYYDIVERIQSGNSHLSQADMLVISDMESKAVVNRELIYKSLGGALSQRAFGEKTKARGVSGTTVASYLLQIDEVGLGSRFTTALGQKSLRRLAALQGKQYGGDEVLVLRAGGPSGASQLDQTHRVVSISELSNRADRMGTATKLDPKRNQTTSIIPIYGRFSSQGGDFDGDSYGIISQYETEQSAYVDLLEESKKLATVAHSLQKSINNSEQIFIEHHTGRNYERALAGELQRKADYEGYQTTISTALDRAVAGDDMSSDRVFKSIWHVMKGSGFSGTLGELRSTPFDRALGLIEGRRKSKQVIPASHTELGSFADSLVATLDDSAQSDVVKERIAYLKKNKSLTPEIINKTFAGAQQQYLDVWGMALGKSLQEQGRLQPESGGTTEFMQNLKGKTTADLENQLERTGADRDYLNALRANAAQKARASYERGVADGKFYNAAPEEVSFLQNQLTEVEMQQQLLRDQIKVKESSLNGLLGQTEGIAQRSVDSMRRHVAAYTGLPMSVLSREAGIFNDAEVFGMVEQHRGVTPGLEDLSKSVADGGKFALNLSETLSQFNSELIQPIAEHLSYLTNERGASKKSFSIYERPEMIRLRSSLASSALTEAGSLALRAIDTIEDSRIKTAIQSAVEGVGFETYLSYDPQQRLDKTLEYDPSNNAIAQAFSTFAKIASNAGGTALSNTAFHALQGTIGSSATNLIGEAYNAITLLMSKTTVARSVSEALASQLDATTGIDSAKTNFVQITKDGFERTIAQEAKWQGANIDPKMQEAKDLVLQIFDNPQHLAKSAFDRAQALTGSLANVQQSIRDSLKQKIDGGMLQSIMSEPVVGTNSIYQILTSDSSTNDERVPALRKFLAEDAGVGIFSAPKERSYQDRHKVTAFGALFLLSDYLTLENSTQAEKMLGLGSGSQHDKNTVQQHRYLAERYSQISSMARATNDPSYMGMLDPDRFVAQSVIDLIAMSSAQRTLAVSFPGGEQQASSLAQMQTTRQSVMSGFGSDVDYGFTSEQVRLQRKEWFAQTQDRTQFHRDIASSLYFDVDTGADLLDTTDKRAAAAAELNIKYDGSAASEYELNSRMTMDFLYTRNKEMGMTVRDLREMREAARAIKYLRFDSLAGNTIFKDFTQASASALEALAITSTRDQITDAHQIAAVSYEAGSQLVEAFGTVRDRLESKYGSLNFDEGSKMPTEVARAYRATQTLAGVFDRMFSSEHLNPKVREYATEMFAVSLASKDQTGNSGWQELSHFLGGMAQLSKTQDALMYAGEDGPSAQVKQMQEAYTTAINLDERNRSTNKIGPNQIAFITGLGQAAAEQTAATAVIPESLHTTARKQARVSLIGAFIGPAFMTGLSTFKGDANLVEHGLAVVQAAAQVSETYNPYKLMSSATLFQVDRMKNTIKQEGLAFGAIKAVTSEVLFEAASRFAHQAIGSHPGAPTRNYLAEVGIAALSLVLSSATAGREYGALEEGEDTSQTQALIALPGMGIGLAESAIEEFMRSSSIDSDFDMQIDYDISLSTKESSIVEAFSTGWLKQLDEGIDERQDGSAMTYNSSDDLLAA